MKKKTDISYSIVRLEFTNLDLLGFSVDGLVLLIWDYYVLLISALQGTYQLG